eukprot:Colp12_sorted_trinity150504_noHs@2385
MVEHNNVAGGSPGGSEEQRVAGAEHRSLRDEDVPALEHGGQLVLLAHALVGEGLLGLARDAGSLGVHQQLSGGQGDESAVNVHGVLVLEVQHVDGVVGAEVAAHPLDAEVVGHLGALHEDVLADAGELRSVEDRLELSGHEGALAGLEGGLALVELVRHEGLGGGGPLGALVEVLLDQLAERTVLEEARSPGHRRFDDLVAHDHEDVAGHGGVQAVGALEVGGDVGLGEVLLGDLGASHSDTFRLKDLGKVIKLSGGFVDHLRRKGLARLGLVHIPPLLRPDSLARHVPLRDSSTLNTPC